MKIFRISQKFNENPSYNYMEVGHNDNEDDRIWMWGENGLEIHDCSAGMHSMIWPIDLVNSKWSGRYDGKTKIVSIVHPAYRPHLKTPNTLVRMLMRAFPDAKEITRFDW